MLLHQTIYQAPLLTPEKTAAICGEDSYTFRQLGQKLDLWAQKLLAGGIRRGDRIGLLLPTGLDLLQLYFACFRLGAIAVPIDINCQSPEIAFILNHSGCRLLVTSENLAARVYNISASEPALEGLYVLGHNSCQEIFPTLGSCPASFAKKDYPAVKMSDPAVIIYTAETSDRLQGVIHTHLSLYHHIINKTKGLKIDREDISLVASPLWSLGALAGIMLPVLAAGGTCILQEVLDPAAYFALIKRFHPTLLALPPDQLLQVLEHPKAGEVDFSRIRTLLVSGREVPQQASRLFRALAGFDLIAVYGRTECLDYCQQPLPDPKIPGSIGKPAPGIRLRLADPQGNIVPAGEIGEIQIKGKAVSSGYWRDPEATGRAFINGWFRTGDLAHRDAQGYYYLEGRTTDISTPTKSRLEKIASLRDEHYLVT